MLQGRTSASGDSAIAVGGDAHGPVMTNPVFLSGGAVPVDVAIRKPDKVFVDAHVEAFTGRAWLLEEVQRVLSGKPCGYVWIEAEAGLGKTALAAWLVKEHGYVSHFARYSRGESTRVALQNLAAQLIRRYRLDDVPQVGMLPDWTYTPDTFEVLLERAAEQARTEGPALVIVMDGADEAETAPGELPWGMPPLLPEGVFVIGTYRTGSPPAHAASSTVLRIDRDDPRHRADLKEYLHGVLRTPELATRLAAAGVSPEHTARTLALRTGGVWVYLRYVLDQIRLGARAADDLDSLPDDLVRYYAGELARWRREPTWQEVGRSLLATLVAAGEPLELPVLARLADVDAPTATHWCDLRLRPFLAVGTGPTRTYELYHASAREFFGGSADPSADHLRALAAELRQDTVTAHRAVAVHYLDRFGSLDTGLPRLAEDPSLAATDGGYPLLHLTRHLEHAGAEADLHRLLRQGGRSNTWHTAHDHAGTLDVYLDDVARARRLAARATDDELARPGQVPSLVLEIRYALIEAAISTGTQQVGPELLARLVETGLWSWQRAVAHARRITTDYRRYAALVALAPLVPSDHQPVFVEELLEAAQECSVITVTNGERESVYSLALAVPAVPSERRQEIISEALRQAAATSTPFTANHILCQLLPHLPRDQHAIVAADALRLADEYARSEHSYYNPVRAYTKVMPHLPSRERADLAERTRRLANTANGTDRWSGLALVAPHLPQDDRAAVAAELLGLARDPDQEHSWRVRLYVNVIPLLPLALRSSVSEEALPLVLGDSLSEPDADGLSDLLCHLPPGRRDSAISDLLDRLGSRSRVRLGTLARHLTGQQLSAILPAILTVGGDDHVEALARLVPVLPDEQRPNVLQRVLTIIRETHDVHGRAGTWALVLPHLSRSERLQVSDEALATAAAIGDRDCRQRALLRLSPFLSQAQQETIAEEATQAILNGDFVDGDTLRAFLLRIPSELVHRAVAAGNWTRSPHQLSQIAPHLDSEAARSLLPAAVALTAEYGNDSPLNELAPRLQAEHLSEAVELTRTITDPDRRAFGLAAFAPVHTGRARATLIREAIADVMHDEYRSSLVKLLAQLLPLWSGSPVRVNRLRSFAERQPRTWDQQVLLTAVMPYLTTQEREVVVARLLDGLSPSRRPNRVLKLVAPFVPHRLLPRLLQLVHPQARFEPVELLDTLLNRTWHDASDPRAVVVTVFRELMPRRSRAAALRAVTVHASTFATVAGPGTPGELATAIDEVCTWWP